MIRSVVVFQGVFDFVRRKRARGFLDALFCHFGIEQVTDDLSAAFAYDRVSDFPADQINGFVDSEVQRALLGGLVAFFKGFSRLLPLARESVVAAIPSPVTLAVPSAAKPTTPPPAQSLA